MGCSFCGKESRAMYYFDKDGNGRQTCGDEECWAKALIELRERVEQMKKISKCHGCQIKGKVEIEDCKECHGEVVNKRK